MTSFDHKNIEDLILSSKRFTWKDMYISTYYARLLCNAGKYVRPMNLRKSFYKKYSVKHDNNFNQLDYLLTFHRYLRRILNKHRNKPYYNNYLA